MITYSAGNRSDGSTYWIARGRGPTIPIVVEGSTRAMARQNWHAIAAKQRRQLESV